jgi:hypothetical protein
MVKSTSDLNLRGTKIESSRHYVSKRTHKWGIRTFAKVPALEGMQAASDAACCPRCTSKQARA